MTKKILIAIAILTGVFAFTFVSCNDDENETKAINATYKYKEEMFFYNP